MPEFQRRWGRKFSPEPLENEVPQVPEGACGTSGTPIPGPFAEKNYMDLPFPIGNGGLDAVQVDMAERHNTRLGVVDPVERRLNVLFWLMQHYQNISNSKLADEVKAAYYSLRNANPDVVRLVRIGELSEETLLKRLRNGQVWLNQEHEKWVNDSSGAATDADFQKALDGWVAMEVQLREQHGYRGCIHGPDGQCPDGDLDVVRCHACAMSREGQTENFISGKKDL